MIFFEVLGLSFMELLAELNLLKSLLEGIVALYLWLIIHPPIAPIIVIIRGLLLLLGTVLY